MYDPYNPLHEPIPQVPFHQPGLGGYGYLGQSPDEIYFMALENACMDGDMAACDELDAIEAVEGEGDLDLDEVDAILLGGDREYWMTEYPLTEEPECPRGPNGEILIARSSGRDGEVRYAECPDVSRIPPCEGGWWAGERVSEGSQGQMEMVWKCSTETERIEFMRLREMMINEIKQNLTTMPDTELLELQHSFSDSLELELFSQGSHHLEQQLADLLIHIDQEVYRRSNPPPALVSTFDWEPPTETKPTVTPEKAPSNLKRVLNTLTGKPHGLEMTEILMYSGVGLAAYLLFWLGGRK